VKPHSSKPNKRAAQAAVRTQLRAKLGWLRGFPVGEPRNGGVPWLALPALTSRAEVRCLEVDRELLRRSTFARNSLRGRFPRALPAAVGDVDAWLARLDARLELLKACVHEGAALPDLEALLAAGRVRTELARRARRLHGSLRGLLLAQQWLCWGDEPRLDAALGLLETRGAELRGLLGQEQGLGGSAALTRLGVPRELRSRVLALRWGDWLEDGQPLLELLADPRCWSLPTRAEGFVQQLKQALVRRRKGSDERERVEEGFPRPAPTLGPQLVEALFALPGREPERRARTLELGGLLFGREQLDAWEGWWALAGEAERRTRKLLGRRTRGKDYRGDLCALEVELGNLAAPPAPVHWGPDPAKAWSQGAGYWVAGSLAARPGVYPLLVEALSALPARPGGRIARVRLLQTWHHELNDGRAARRVARLLAALTEVLRALPEVGDDELLWLCDGLSGDLQDHWISDRAPLRELEPAVRALLAWIGREPTWRKHWGPFDSYRGWAALLEASRVSADAEAACELTAALQRLDAQGHEDEARPVIVRLGGGDPARCAALVQAWAGPWREHQIAELKRLGREPALAALLGGALLDGEGRRLRRLVGWSRLLGILDADARRVGWRPPPRAGTPDWRRYPDGLQDALGALARHAADAEQVAERVLGKDVPDPARLQVEVEALRARLGPDAPRGLAARAQALEERIARPRPLSPARLERCRAKLQRRARLAWLDRVEVRLRERVLASLRAQGSGGAPSATPLPEGWLEDDATLELVGALAGLRPAFRALGFRLLGVRAGPPPWDLRDDPANRAFLRRLVAAGYDPDPWVDGIGPRSLEVGGARWALDLEPDPLQALRMGAPFNTCLAPGAFNFFSAVSNAVDVNKRVLYARDREGTIRGRCLLALTRSHGLLAFRVYGHEQREALEAAVRGYVEALAAAVGVPVVARGHVETLVAPDWYDDGPVDLAGRLEGLDRFAERLPDLEPDALLEVLGEHVDDPGPGAVLAILQRGLLTRRPKLIVPLLELLPRGPEAVDPWTRLQIVELLVQAGARGPALELLPQISRALRGGDDEWGRTQAQARVADAYTSLGLPHRAMRLLRRNRLPRFRSWTDDYAHCLRAAGRALRALHRPRKALEAYRAARAQGAEDVTAEIRELEAELGG